VGFYDGILVGENAPAQSNVLVNVIGDTSCRTLCGTIPIRAIHISSIQTGGKNHVQDLSILGVANDVTGRYTIRDDLTGGQITDPSVDCMCSVRLRTGTIPTRDDIPLQTATRVSTPWSRPGSSR
jgi:hypothetical protein